MVVGFEIHKYKGNFIHSRKKLQIVYENIFFHCDVQCSSTKDVIYYALEKLFLLVDPCIKFIVKNMKNFFHKLLLFVVALKPNNQCIS